MSFSSDLRSHALLEKKYHLNKGVYKKTVSDALSRRNNCTHDAMRTWQTQPKKGEEVLWSVNMFVSRALLLMPSCSPWQCTYFQVSGYLFLVDWRVLTDWRKDPNPFHHDHYLKRAFPVAFKLRARFPWSFVSYLEWSGNFSFCITKAKRYRGTKQSLQSMQEDAKPRIEIFTSQSRFYWINLTSTTMACAKGTKGYQSLLILYSHISRHQIKITSV